MLSRNESNSNPARSPRRSFALGLGLAALTLVLAAPGTYAAPYESSSISLDEACTPEINQVAGPKVRLAKLVQIDGRLGGVATIGRWTLVVPPGAYDKNAAIQMTVPDQSKMEIHLSISPASANAFKVPVILKANNLGGTISLASELRMFYYNPSTGCWDDVTSGVDVATSRVEALLWHFSKYSSGKSGW